MIGRGGRQQKFGPPPPGSAGTLQPAVSVREHAWQRSADTRRRVSALLRLRSLAFPAGRESSLDLQDDAPVDLAGAHLAEDVVDLLHAGGRVVAPDEPARGQLQSLLQV